MTLTRRSRALVIAGALLFLIGLLQGLAIPLFVNPRMGLSAHLTAVQSGLALMVLSLCWSRAAWGSRVETLSFGAVVGGIYALWVGLTLAAATGASRSLPIAGQGFGAAPAAELLVSALVIVPSAMMIVGWGLFVIAVARGSPAQSALSRSDKSII